MLATAGYAAATARYNTIDLASRVEGASPHRLIAVLYDELIKSLDTLAVGLVRQRHADTHRRDPTQVAR